MKRERERVREIGRREMGRNRESEKYYKPIKIIAGYLF